MAPQGRTLPRPADHVHTVNPPSTFHEKLRNTFSFLLQNYSVKVKW